MTSLQRPGDVPNQLPGTSLERQIKTSPGRHFRTSPGRQIETSPGRSNRIFRGRPGDQYLPAGYILKVIDYVAIFYSCRKNPLKIYV